MKTKLVRTSVIGLAVFATLLLFSTRQARAVSNCSTPSAQSSYMNWSTAAWSCGHVPGFPGYEGDNVTIGNSVTLDANVSIGSFTVSSPYGSFGADVSGRSMTVTGNWAYNSGTGNGVQVTTTTFAGTSAQTISSAGSQDFYNLVINNPTSVSLTMGSSNHLYVDGDLTISAGTFAQGVTHINLMGNLVNNGILDGGSAGVDFQGTTAITGTGTTTFRDVDIDGTVTAPSGNLYVTGYWRRNMTFNPNNGTVVMSGTGTQVIQPGSSTFYNLTINNGATVAVGGGTAVTIKAGGTLTVNGTLTFPSYCSSCTPPYGLVQSDTSGVSTLAMGANGLIRAIVGVGSLIRAQTGGTFDTASIDTSGTVEQIYGPAGVTDRNYNNLTFNNSAQWTWTLATDRTINGNLTVAGDGDLILTGVHTLNVKGNLALTTSHNPALYIDPSYPTIVNLNH